MLEKIGALARVSLMVAMQYRSNFLLDLLGALVRTASSLAPLLLVYSHVDHIAGWSPAEATVVLSGFLILLSFNEGLMEPNLGEVVESVRRGTFDLVLMKPLDAQLLVSLRRINPAGVWNLLAGIGVGLWALQRLPGPTPLDALVGVVLMISGLAALYGLWLLAICTSFYFVRVDNLRFLIWTASDTGRWPVQVFGGWLKWILVTIVPIGMITTFPAMAFRGTWTLALAAQGVGVGLAFVVISRLAWRRSLAQYTSASS